MNQSITAFFEADHDRLDALFQKFQQLKRSDFAQAKANFREFLQGLKRHIVWEEEILFPVFEQKTGMRDVGPTAVMRMEHRMIHEALDEIHAKVRVQDPASDEAEQRLLSVLSQHNLKEENILYPTIDRLVSDAERDAVLLKVRETSALETGACCGCG